MNVFSSTGTATPETPGQRLHFRLFETAVVAMALHLGWSWASYLPLIERELSPTGVGRYADLSLLFSPAGAVLLPLALLAFAAASYFRIWRWGYAGAIAIMHLIFAARFSLGKVPHGGTLTGMMLLLFAVGFILVVDPGQRRRFVMGAAVFFTGFAYMLSAASKLVASGPMWVNGTHLWLWMAEKQVDALSLAGTYTPNLLQQVTGTHLGVATAMLTFGLLTEAAGFLLWSRRFRPLVATALIGMHVGIALVMNIAFTYFIVTLVVLCYPWDRLLDRLASAPLTASAARRLAAPGSGA